MPSNSNTETWLITGAGRGMGVDFAKAALTAGHNVVATGRTPETVSSAVDERLIISISSTAGVVGGAFGSAYAASKFGLEGWMEGLAGEVEPYGVRTMIVEPGFFRTELLQPESTTFGDLSVDDYAERTAETIPVWQAMNGRQAGDPAKLARALIELAGSESPPLRWVAGEDAVEAVEQKAELLLEQVHAHRAPSTSLAHDDVAAAA